MLEAEVWVAVAFVILMALMYYLRVHVTVLNALDQRQARIKAELDEAKRLRDEAQSLLEAYQQKHREAETEAEAILAGARAEAERIAQEAAAKLEEFIARRTRMAETKIAQAEVQALADVRAAAADAAVSAAEKILVQSARNNVADTLIAKGIDEVKKKLN
ncbi:MAG: H+-transporting two-sector ATPase, subunit [Xanthobacteraceae bacterium]|nr:H+-transporting two-sector ATPase, subunit [Xanthobacteraceae bacterium]